MATQQHRSADPRRPATLAGATRPVSEERIRVRAYELYLQRGGDHGHDWEDWFRAERELRGRRGRASEKV
jgi:hypothetical protein